MLALALALALPGPPLPAPSFLLRMSPPGLPPALCGRGASAGESPLLLPALAAGVGVQGFAGGCVALLGRLR